MSKFLSKIESTFSQIKEDNKHTFATRITKAQNWTIIIASLFITMGLNLIVIFSIRISDSLFLLLPFALILQFKINYSIVNGIMYLGRKLAIRYTSHHQTT